ncbi:MAG: metallophosphoesterase, partial [Clostridia bacterium]|nr:metallophosphoesterase [Clostridia bacterium]
MKRAIKIVLLFVLFVFLWWFNTYTLKTETFEVSDARIKDEITIVQISDLHGQEFGKDNNSLIEKISDQKPDLIFATGDMF